jgi:hypothetical protein
MGKYDHQGSFTFWGNRIFELPEGLGLNVNYSMYSPQVEYISIDELGIVCDDIETQVDPREFTRIEEVIKPLKHPLHESNVLIEFFSLITELQIEAWEDFQSKRKAI